MPDWFFIPLQWGICVVARTGASLLWMFNQVWLLIAAMFYYLRWWLEHSLLNTLLVALFGPDNVATPWIAGSLGLAVLLGGTFLILRNLGIRHSPVDLRKAAAWVLFLGFLFANHTWIFDQLESFRNGLAGAAYQTAGGISQGIMNGDYGSPGGELPNPHSGPIDIPHLFPQTTQPYVGPEEITALDLAAYSMEANENDIVQPPVAHPPLPAQFDHDYYNNGDFFSLLPPADNDTRNRAVNKALLGMGVMVINSVPAYVALVAAGISFGLALTAAVLFCSLPLALPFVFFEATEGIALGIMRAYLMLIVKTWIINLILAIFLGFNAYWAASGNVGLFVAMSCITLYFCWQFVHLTRQTFYQAVNAITGGIGQATGVKMIDPVRATQEIAGRTAQAAISAAAIIATGGAATPAVAGALLSSAGARAGGSALLYGATRHQKEPGEFARRGLVARQSSSSEVLTPDEQRLATRAAAIQTGQAGGDRAWAAATLGQLGQRAQSRRAGTTAMRQTLAQAGILPAEEQQREQMQQQREQMQRMEQALGLDLRGATVTPSELEDALTAAAVLEGHTPGDRTQAQATLQRIGRQVQTHSRQRVKLRATLADAGVLNPEDDSARLQRLQQLLGVSSAATHLSPGELEEAVVLAAGELPEPEVTLDGTSDPLRRYGAHATRQRARLDALRARLTEAGILPPAQPGGRGPGRSNPPSGSGAAGGPSPRSNGPVSGGHTRPAATPGQPPPSPAGDEDDQDTPPSPVAGESAPVRYTGRRRPGAPSIRVSPPAALPAAAGAAPQTTPALPGPAAPPAPNDSPTLPPPPGRFPALPAPMSAGTGTQSSPPPLLAAGPEPAAPDIPRAAPPVTGLAPAPAPPPGNGSPPGALVPNGEPEASLPASPEAAAADASPARGKGGRNPGYWAWRAKQAPGQPLNKPRGKRKS